MCISLVAFEAHPEFRIILAFNRDENHKRLTEPLGFWKDYPSILGGRDLVAGGTWLGVSKMGRIANITNYRDRRIPRKEEAPSRGLLVSQFLSGVKDPRSYLEDVQSRGAEYNGFSLLIGGGEELFYYSNIENKIKELTRGIYGLSNHLLNSPWKKVEMGKEMLKSLIESSSLDVHDIFGILSDRTTTEESRIPDTGYGKEFERMASPLFIANTKFGTRSSSVIFVDYEGKVSFFERSFDKDSNVVVNKKIQFRIEKRR
jgi:uncharacterized protein with NRDE domain